MTDAFTIIGKNKKPIRTVQEWKDNAPPKSPGLHWKDGRSAKELAKAWCGTGSPIMPAELGTLLDSHPDARGFKITQAFAEHEIRFDSFFGGPCNADLALIGTASAGKVCVVIEAKADEPFSDTVEKRLQAAKTAKTESNAKSRIQGLLKTILPEHTEGLPADNVLRYQLLTGTAGALALAAQEHADLAVFIVHEFVTNQTNPQKLAINATAYKDFLHRLMQRVPTATELQRLLGPFHAPCRATEGYAPEFSSGMPLLIGKVSTDCR